jgi:hypothetical protein
VSENQLFVQPSSFDVGAGTVAFQWYRGIPTPGVSGGPPAVGGIATCRDLLYGSPPTLLEEYELYSYSIGYTVMLSNGVAYASTPNVQGELALLVNDRVRYVSTSIATVSTGTTSALFQGVWVSDLIIPIRVGARDRLSLRAGFFSDQAATVDGKIIVGIQQYSSGFQAYESSLSYRTYALPGARRL